MSKTTGKRRKFDFYILPVIEEMGLKRVIEQVGVERVAKEIGLDRVIEKGGLEDVIREKGFPWLLSKLTPEQRRELQELL